MLLFSLASGSGCAVTGKQRALHIHTLLFLILLVPSIFRPLPRRWSSSSRGTSAGRGQCQQPPIPGCSWRPSKTWLTTLLPRLVGGGGFIKPSVPYFTSIMTSVTACFWMLTKMMTAQSHAQCFLLVGYSVSSSSRRGFIRAENLFLRCVMFCFWLDDAAMWVPMCSVLCYYTSILLLPPWAQPYRSLLLDMNWCTSVWTSRQQISNWCQIQSRTRVTWM